MIKARHDLNCVKCKQPMDVDRFYDEGTKLIFLITRCDNCDNTQLYVRVKELMNKYKIKNETLVKYNKPFTIPDPANPYRFIRVVEIDETQTINED